MSKLTHIVTKEEHGMPLKSIVKTNFNLSSRFMTKIKKDKLIFVNGKPFPNWMALNEGDEISINMPNETNNFTPENIPIKVVFEDENILIIDKQPNLVVHPTKGKPNHTLSNALSYKLLNEKKQYKIRFVNRLDMNTSGLIVVAKNSFVQDCLVKEMKSNIMEKSYVAIVKGIFKEKKGTINLPLGRPDENEVERWILKEELGGSPSVTHYKVLEEFKNVDLFASSKYKALSEKNKDLNINDGYDFSLVELHLETGRTHQIRVHLSYIGHPIIGDHLYINGDPFQYRKLHGDSRPSLSEYHKALKKELNETSDSGSNTDSSLIDNLKNIKNLLNRSELVSNLIDRQALHAHKLQFTHPITKEKICVTAPVPSDMENVLSLLREV